jgi:malonyl-CoA/methylmalonyl-CoA synthetase
MMANPIFDALFAPLVQKDRPVLILQDGTTISGREFYHLIRQAALQLVARGVAPGDRVAAQIDKSPHALALYGATIALGAVFLPLNTAYTAHEVGYFLGDAAPAVFVVTPSRADAFQGRAGMPRHVLTLGAAGEGTFGTPSSLLSDWQPTPRAPDDLAAILYTSGTTGRSKGAMLTHRNLLSNAETLAHLWRFTDRDVLLHALPIFHTHGLFVASNISLLTGGQMIFLPGFDTDTVLRLMPGATAMMGVPTFYTRLLVDPRLTRDATAHMRLFVSGSAPLLAETHAAFHARTGHRILERYGMTETNMNTSNPYEGDRRAGTVGFPLPGVELRLTEAEKPGDVGGIEVRGPNVFRGYWNMPEKTAEELRPDGWFITGDLGRFDADGYLHIVGRARDLIITGGFNVYPIEVEEALDAIPGVAESAVIGLPHPDFGEAVFAVLTVTDPDLSPDAALSAIRDRLARFKQPKAATVVDALPRNAMGKVQKAALRAQYAGWFRPK